MVHELPIDIYGYPYNHYIYVLMIPPPQDPNVEDDLLLEVIIVCGTFSLDERCATLMVQAGIPDLLITILKGTHSLVAIHSLLLIVLVLPAKQEDDEVVLQIVYLFHQLVLHEPTRVPVISQTRIHTIKMTLYCSLLCLHIVTQRILLHLIVVSLTVLHVLITEAPDYLLELMNDKNKEICKLCSRTLDVMAVSL